MGSPLEESFGSLPLRDWLGTFLPRAMIFTFLILVFLPGRAQVSQPSVQSSQVTGSMPKSAAIVNQLPKINDWVVGDIQVTFIDGHTELVTKGQKCGLPHISKNGDVGWTVWNDFTTDRYYHTSETLNIRMRDGTIKSFQPNNLFITDWGFADDDSAVVIKSMGHHGAASFIKYNIFTGQELGRQDGYLPYAEMAKWAQPYADDKP